MKPIDLTSSAAGVCAACLICPTVALAQMPADIAEKIAAMGRVIELEDTGKIYAPLHEKEPYTGIKVARDVKYGEHPRQLVEPLNRERPIIPGAGTPARQSNVPAARH
jgi:hypothetical protein